MIQLEVEYLPFDAARYCIDSGAAIAMIRERRPKVVILGSSNFLFPHPVNEIAEVMKRELPQSVLVYDGSHVMGFLAAGRFQNPLGEGADLVFGSTHKTLPGPQGGIIYSNRNDLMESICAAVYPALVTNHHLFRLPSLGLALLEMELWGAEYASQTVTNAQALGAALETNGLSCVCVNGEYTRSHTLLACVSEYGKGSTAAEVLEKAGIITTAALLPEMWGTEGIRIGVQEITRLGAQPEQMKLIARWFAQALRGERSAEAIAGEAAEFRTALGPVRFTWAEESA